MVIEKILTHLNEGLLAASARCKIQLDFAAIGAKSEVNGCSITVDFREKGFYSYYTHLPTSEFLARRNVAQVFQSMEFE